jgi:hypothetical protein
VVALQEVVEVIVFHGCLELLIALIPMNEAQLSLPIALTGNDVCQAAWQGLRVGDIKEQDAVNSAAAGSTSVLRFCSRTFQTRISLKHTRVRVYLHIQKRCAADLCA